MRPDWEKLNALIGLMNWKWLGFFLLLLALLAPSARLFAGGDEVVVLYNSNVPESKAVADYYAAKRNVPASQIFGFDLTTDETISRDDFQNHLQQPLVDDLVNAGLWKFGEQPIAATPTQPAHTEERVIESKIRYAVLCWGMPLKIAPDYDLQEVESKLMRSDFRRNEASVDSELVWLPLIKLKIPLTGPLPNLLYNCTNTASLVPQNGLLLTARLDGPTPEIARGLVDKALEAESNGFWGRAYFDILGRKPGNSYYLGDHWFLTGAEICQKQGFDVEIYTNENTMPASYPISQIAIYVGWYTSDVSGPFTLPEVEFMPGAFAYHLHSFSAETLRSTTRHWCGPLLAKGATCTMGCVYEPYLQFTPNIAVFLHAFCSGYTFGQAAWVAQPALSWQTTVIGDPLYQPFNQPPPKLHEKLAREHNPLIAWSFNRLVNLDLARGVHLPILSQFLENGVPETQKSPVLMEKLAELYDDEGKPSSAIDDWQRALTLQPTRQQRLRLRLTLAQKLEAQGRIAEAMDDDRQLLEEVPDYSGKDSVEKNLKRLKKVLSGKS